MASDEYGSPPMMQWRLGMLCDWRTRQFADLWGGIVFWPIRRSVGFWGLVAAAQGELYDVHLPV
jgi:hypothetical protein